MKEEENYYEDSKKKINRYLKQRLLLLRLQATEKISKVASGIIITILTVIIALFLLVFLSITAGFWLASLTGSYIAGFGIVALFYLVVFLFILIFLKKILRNFFINKLIIFFHKKY